MSPNRTPVLRILLPALVVLILTGIVVSEIPELLLLTEDTTNDFTIRKTNSLIPSVVLDSNNQLAMAGLDSYSASRLLFSHPCSLDIASIVPPKLFLLYSDFRK